MKLVSGIMFGAIERPEGTRRSYLSRFFLLRFGLVGFTLLVLLGIVFGLLSLSGKHEEEHNRIVNILGRQRMLTQLMAKEASRLAAIYEAMQSPDRVQPEETLRAKIVEVKGSLGRAADLFEATFKQVKTGRIDFGADTLTLFVSADASILAMAEEIESAWTVFGVQVDRILESRTNDRSFREALIYINENNEALLALSERLNALAIERFAAQAAGTQRNLTILIVCLIATGLLILAGTYRLIIEPYNLFYRGLRSLGSGHELPKHSRSLSPLMREVGGAFAMLRDMVNLIGVINQGTSFYDTLELIFRTFKSYIPYDYIGVATFLGYEGSRLTASYGMSDGSFPGLPQRLLGQTVEIGTTSLKGILEAGQPRIINDLEEYSSGRPMQDYTRIILEEGIRSSITLPLSVNGKALGFLFFSSRKRQVYTEMHADFLRNIRDAVALSFEKDIFVDDLVYSSTLALAKMAEARDEDTADHLDRMRRYSVLLAQSLLDDGTYADSLTPEFIHALGRFSPMHDIGKVGIRDNVLLKPGKLTDEEWVHMRTHTIYGANVLREAESNIARSGRTLFRSGIQIAQSHHERWNGTGYPDGLSGQDIPLAARIVSVADVLDALTTRRPYKEPYGFDESIAMILAGRGTQFDPAVIDGLERHLAQFRELYAEFTVQAPESY